MVIITRSKTFSLGTASGVWSGSQRGLIAVHYAHSLRLLRRYSREVDLLKFAHRHGVIHSLETLKDVHPSVPLGSLSFLVSPPSDTTISCSLNLPVTDENFLDRLSSLRIPLVPVFDVLCVNFDAPSIESMASHLSSLVATVSRQACTQLAHFIQLGRDLQLSKSVYNSLKPKGGVPWQTWVHSSCHISKSYANKLIVLSDLARDYPGVASLSITATALYASSRRFRQIMESNPELVFNWLT